MSNFSYQIEKIYVNAENPPSDEQKKKKYKNNQFISAEA